MVLPTLEKDCFLNNEINYSDPLKFNTLIQPSLRWGLFFIFGSTNKIKPMKTIKILMLSSLLAFTSCASDPCVDVTCYNDGVCDDGTCMCADWYEGADCSTEERAKYYGSYIGVMNFYDPNGDLASSSNDPLVLSAGSTINEINGDGLPFVLNASGMEDFNIPITQDNDPDLGSIFFQGNGSFSGNLLSVNGSMDVQGDTYTFSFTGTK